MIIKTFNKTVNASFYIARVGQVGKPMWKPYTANNSFMVISNNPESDFQKVKAAYESGAFNYYALGSCQPCIRISDVRSVVEKSQNIDEKHLAKLAAIDKYIQSQQEVLNKQKQLLVDMQRSLFCAC
ncbi:conserved hypothetical protein [Vibrio crassostreae]|uniref:DUF6943 family protein n=1 Tax=Vibrio cyclitrophicus TaxID=47951 RepID=UPI001F534D6A|nr:hypothetical protein [Vibrio cyclitrophicus]CAH6849483.1 conserved hypothetical protein [Vibrio chagasii]CAK1880564.1 conserved hypothetical protein [Vibrio crassostreae]CAK1884691.1 conserved hypothetical protein [Vibrio crassostreae]CAK2318054.1 conserved hypothetical protein [Vibrio crassostreae]CAK2602515.1 conserved hypothetical protein [Vibrio crassostreae]